MQKSPIIMLIRHGEKPSEAQSGVLPTGEESKHSLIVRGWQRAGALIPLFAPSSGGLRNEALARPAYLFATCPDAKGADSSDQSRREEETLTGLSEVLGVSLRLNFGKGQEAEVAEAAIASDGPVLIAWDHNKILDLSRHVAPDQALPAEWPSNRFDMIFVFCLQPDGTYAFSQVPQLLLAGDTDQVIV